MGDFLTLANPQDTEAAFYRAFAEADLDLMLKVWDVATDVVCIHPMGNVLLGVTAVAGSWREILAGERPMRVQVRPINWQTGPELAVSLVEEVISVAGEDRPRPIILATNAYRLTNTGWRMILHHASPSVIRLDEEAGGATRWVH